MLDKEIREILECTCQRMRRSARRMTQIYDRVLEPAGLTTSQFGLLGRLYGTKLARANAALGGLSVGEMAEQIGMDPTTLNRNLKPLQKRGLVKDAINPADARVRIVQITDKGERELIKALPLWRQAQAQVAKALGTKSTLALNELLDTSVAKLSHLD